MNQRNSGHLAIHRRADEVTFLKQRLRNLEEMLQGEQPQEGERGQVVTWRRERDLADELLHTRHTEPLGETLQRRLAMAELVCRDLAPIPRESAEPPVASWSRSKSASMHAHRRDYGMAETERRALAEMLQQWWAWLRRL